MKAMDSETRNRWAGLALGLIIGPAILAALFEGRLPAWAWPLLGGSAGLGMYIGVRLQGMKDGR